MEKLPKFKLLWKNYSGGRTDLDGLSPSQIGDLIGGRVETNIDGNIFDNTCVIRASRALNLSGHKIPRNFKGMEVSSGKADSRGNKFYHAFRVGEFYKYMISTFGEPAIDFQRSVDSKEDVQSMFLSKKGLIIFQGGMDRPRDGSDRATGHVDIWSGSMCKGNYCVMNDYFKKTKRISLWEAE